jgi:hypothetical protein
VLNTGICFVSQETGKPGVINFFRFDNRRISDLGTLPKPAYRFNPFFAVSPDGRWILFSQVDQVVSDIMLVENFR